MTKSLKKQKIGILPGSFDPAHKGHVHISKVAFSKLKLDALWWVVAKNNPFKNNADNYDFRLNSAKKESKTSKFISVSEVEKENNFEYTIDTVRFLKKKWPNTRFFLIIGEDLLYEVPKWKHGMELLEEIKIVVFKRTQHNDNIIINQEFLSKIDQYKLTTTTSFLRKIKLPAWTFISDSIMNISSREIKAVSNIRDKIVDLLENNKGYNLKVYDTVNHLADYLIVVSGISPRHVDALTQRLIKLLKENKVPRKLEAGGANEWNVVDTGDLIVHIFTSEKRDFYGIDLLFDSIIKENQ